jgi:hypothetical protein
MATTPEPTSAAAPAPVASATDERIEHLKHLAGYIPEVWLARTVARWVKEQPAGELSPPPAEQTMPQAR